MDIIAEMWAELLDRGHDGIDHETITICHFPPGTSKWNAVEHRLFSFIATNWRGKPLESLEVINLIAATTTNTGLKLYAPPGHRLLPQRRRGQ